MERDVGLTKKVKRFCSKIGVDIVGFANPSHFNRFPKYNQPESFLEGSQTVIIIGIHLFDIILDSWSQSSDKSKNLQFADSILENLCNKIRNYLSKQEFDSKVITYTPGFFLKDSSALAGIGPIGKNNLLITEKFGSQVRLRALTTTAPLVCGEPILTSKYCEGCNICVEACPANAFPEGKYNKEICLAYNLSHLRKLSENTSIWCNVCIESCPVGKVKENSK